MIIKKYCLAVLFFCITFLVFADDNTNDLTITINSITFEGLKATNPKYLLSMLSIKKGSVWNEEVKRQTENKLSRMRAIIESVEIKEEIVEKNKVNINIIIQEKSSFIFFPFATYSNSRGLMPKIIFRDYNLGGYGKYLNTKIEFLPTDSLNLFLDFKDPAVLSNNDLSYELTGEFQTSAINYYVNVDNYGNSKGIAPIGVIGGDSISRWTDELFFLGDLSFQLSYLVPIYDIKIKSRASIDYKSIRSTQDSAGELPIDIIQSDAKLNLSFPIKKIGASIDPQLYYNYEFDFGDLDLDPIKGNRYYSNGNDDLDLMPQLGFSFSLPNDFGKISPYFGLNYERTSTFVFNPDGSIKYSSIIPVNEIDLILGLDYNKSFTFRTITHTFKIHTEYKQIFGYMQSLDKVDFNALFDIYYKLDFPFLNLHKFSMRLYFYSRYNQVHGFKRYKIGEDPGTFTGWIGLICNLKYTLPLFLINTPKFATISMKKSLLWQVFWDFYIDLGISQANQNYGVFTFDYNYLHIWPALGVATSIRFAPKFVPIEIVIDVGFDIYKILREKSLSGGSLILNFSIDDKI